MDNSAFIYLSKYLNYDNIYSLLSVKHDLFNNEKNYILIRRLFFVKNNDNMVKYIVPKREGLYRDLMAGKYDKIMSEHVPDSVKHIYRYRNNKLVRYNSRYGNNLSSTIHGLDTLQILGEFICDLAKSMKR
jgi:hypothetical protein